jgi:hypothetical protein
LAQVALAHQLQTVEMTVTQVASVLFLVAQEVIKAAYMELTQVKDLAHPQDLMEAKQVSKVSALVVVAKPQEQSVTRELQVVTAQVTASTSLRLAQQTLAQVEAPVIQVQQVEPVALASASFGTRHKEKNGTLCKN